MRNPHQSKTALVPVLLLLASPALPQRPSIPPQPIAGPILDYVPVAQSDAIAVPSDVTLGQIASVAIDGRGHLFLLNRGDPAVLEFDAAGAFVRAFGNGLFERAHSLTLVSDGFWVTDVSRHTVVKLDMQGQVTMTLGTPGASGAWDEATGSHSFDEPTDVAVAPDGSIFISQGHGRGEPRVLKFDAGARFVKSWGGRGALPWEFAVAHSIVIDDAGSIYVADRENRRIVVFDEDGGFIKGWVYRGMACSLALTPDARLYMTTGFDAQIVSLDLDGHVLGVTGRSGEGPNEYGEAHDLAVRADGTIFIADVVNRRLQELVPR
jgi:DNA-binding beta-propeller fold protein YncE